MGVHKMVVSLTVAHLMVVPHDIAQQLHSSPPSETDSCHHYKKYLLAVDRVAEKMTDSADVVHVKLLHTDDKPPLVQPDGLPEYPGSVGGCNVE